MKKLDFIINNMYLTINEKTDNLNIKLKIKEDFSNNDFFQNKDIPNTQENIINIETNSIKSIKNRKCSQFSPTNELHENAEFSTLLWSFLYSFYC